MDRKQLMDKTFILDWLKYTSIALFVTAAMIAFSFYIVRFPTEAVLVSIFTVGAIIFGAGMAWINREYR